MTIDELIELARDACEGLSGEAQIRIVYQSGYPARRAA